MTGIITCQISCFTCHMAQTTFGSGGWVRLDDPDMPGPVYLRYRSDNGRPVLTEFYIDGRGREIPSGLFRTLDLASFTAWALPSEPKTVSGRKAAMRGEGDWLERSSRYPGPDLSRLASHFHTGFGRQAAHWVSDSMRAQIKGSTVQQAPMGRDPKVNKEPRPPDPVKAPKNGLTDDFLRSVADNYVWAARNRQRPAPMIATQSGCPVRTVRSWIMKARDRGILTPTTRGKVG